MKKIADFEEKGQAVVEFALVLPLILLIVFATIDSGWYFLNRNALKIVAKTAVYEIKEPIYADFHTGGAWHEGGTPSWADGNSLTHYDTYDAWLPFGLRYSGDTEESFKSRVQAKSGLIDLDNTVFTLKGGWLLRRMAGNIPGNTGDAVRAQARTGVYYVDITVRIDYAYHPLTLVGNIIFCRGAGVKIISSEERLTYQLGDNNS